ncbi:MAG: hypothetical protein KJ558_05015 [Gammaproteobacteria bacterium]|nr:hypothetical protein [Gammaproteobacteria bacterium]MBU1654179.1 hypothetical protein [Gammaproteobacteria bacterium]MBU1961819.1 hypothetical protein [Gammaproteobacteria bacterium]
MPIANHVHLVAVPATDDGLLWELKPLHMRYGQRLDGLLNPESSWSAKFIDFENWATWLAEGDESEKQLTLRRNIEKGLPCGGSEGFVQNLGEQVGRLLEYRPRGRPKKREKGSVPFFASAGRRCYYLDIE